jgi:hypothetical protein
MSTNHLLVPSANEPASFGKGHAGRRDPAPNYYVANAHPARSKTRKYSMDLRGMDVKMLAYVV